jgi:hypothetical protein
MCQLNVEPSPIPNSILRSEQAPSWNWVMSFSFIWYRSIPRLERNFMMCL